MKRPVIVVNKNTPKVVETFSRLGDVRALETAAVSTTAVRDADILIVRSETKVDHSLLEGSSVRFVGTVTIGTDHIDLEYLRSRGIVFASAPGSNSTSVAEYVAAALLTWAQRSGETLKGKSMGIVGVGNVGTKVVHIAVALGMHVLLNDPPKSRMTGNGNFVSLDELMSSDVVTLHVPLTTAGRDATHHLFGEARLRAMKRGSVLLNTSRGAVVDGSALHSALVSKHLSSAILDVWEGEPRIDTALLDRVLLGTPHIAGYSLDGKLDAVRMVYSEACKFLGLPIQWSGEEFDQLGDPIRLPSTERSDKDETALYHIVRQAYDIELDDYMLRRASSLLPEQQGDYFMKLRAEYRTRREFSTRAVDVPDGRESLRALATQLGFKTEVTEPSRWDT